MCNAMRSLCTKLSRKAEIKLAVIFVMESDCSLLGCDSVKSCRLIRLDIHLHDYTATQLWRLQSYHSTPRKPQIVYVVFFRNCKKKIVNSPTVTWRISVSRSVYFTIGGNNLVTHWISVWVDLRARLDENVCKFFSSCMELNLGYSVTTPRYLLSL